MTAPAFTARDLGLRYGRRWALRDCSFFVPEGRVVALVGPNGAGKTTLLHLAVGLLRPTTGQVAVYGHEPRRGRGEVLARVGFLAQDKPLYRSFTVADMLRMGAHLNPGWDQAGCQRRLGRLGIGLDRRVGRLSGGQRAQVALALALAKQPDLLLLDEPVAELDPLARREFMQTLMEEVAGRHLTVMFSSHAVAELDQVCDHLILLGASRLQLTGDIEELRAGHKRLTGPHRQPPYGPYAVVSASHTARQTSLVVRTSEPVHDPTWTVSELSLEDLVLAYMSNPDQAAPTRPTAVTVPREVR